MLPSQFQSKLKLARAGSGVSNQPCAWRNIASRSKRGDDGHAKIRTVENIERLYPELKVDSLGYFSVLEERSTKVAQARPSQDVPTSIGEQPYH